MAECDGRGHRAKTGMDELADRRIWSRERGRNRSPGGAFAPIAISIFVAATSKTPLESELKPGFCCLRAPSLPSIALVIKLSHERQAHFSAGCVGRRGLAQRRPLDPC